MRDAVWGRSGVNTGGHAAHSASRSRTVYHYGHATLTTDQSGPRSYDIASDARLGGMDGDLLLWVAAGYSALLVVGAVWIAVALFTHRIARRTRHRQLERDEQHLRNVLEKTYRRDSTRRFD
jgi:hypothetical protein